ncbi:lipoyl(octanoyl) transferase LipB [Alterisphingorhabdus coralli]|uniref:Octanoyltransferase n=1 Tax=Alterisphingorhabdus coralli TaxID=3071408 RepID=A0AA97F6J7_9SPHN|nr:lipoyl(octanoyl) transferase LipB [Parasphingorhabdus sp. SCSIO 66989]WOE75131.1 lipoyl(octanoyl) transferase LipB [Parasphingorhabdus sp. SCSIO 66989]
MATSLAKQRSGSPKATIAPPQWQVSDGLTGYEDALATMEARNQAVQAGDAEELIWLLEHPPLYTAGTSADPSELLTQDFPVFETGRGGRHTYHGPGQRVGYLMLDLNRRGRDIRCFVHALEGWVINALSDFDVAARRAEGRIGIWVDGPDGREAKIGAIGIRVRKWVTMHGFAVNIDPALDHFTGIIPCGISEYPVTSLRALGKDANMDDFDAALERHLPTFLNALGTNSAKGQCA